MASRCWPSPAVRRPARQESAQERLTPLQKFVKGSPSLFNVRALHLASDLARACEIVQGTYHPVLRSHRHHDSVALFAGTSFALAIACQASRWLRISSRALFNSIRLSSARLIR